MPDNEITIAEERLKLMELMDQGSYRVPKREVDENILVATWNISQFGGKKKKRALQYIADICERFDIIAIQEVKTNLTGLSKLQNLLPGDYRILVSDPTGNYERFAFLYDQRTVTATGLVCEIGFDFSSSGLASFKVRRMPYCASFRAGRFDFIICSVHIYEGSNVTGGLVVRKKEIQELAKFIKKRADTEATKVFDRDFFVVGDFNIEKEGDEFFDALTEDDDFIMPDKLNSLTTNFKRTKTFDKIAWAKRKDRNDFIFSGNLNVVPFYKVLYQDDAQDKGGYYAVSDHLPLWAEFRINELTQQLDQIINP
jgi:endonuclease/exonuclease/phosphatase family metal-dependent hydrolase